MGFHGHEHWSVGEDKLKTFRRQKHHPLNTGLKLREHRPGAPGAGCHKLKGRWKKIAPTATKKFFLWLLVQFFSPPPFATKPADAGKTSRPVHAGDLTVSQMRRLQMYTEKYDGAGRLSGLPLLQTGGRWKKLHQQPQKRISFFVAVGAFFFHRPLCRHTMVSKLKLDHNEVPRAFVQKYRRSVLPKSLRTHPDHTPHIDLSSLFVHSHKYFFYGVGLRIKRSSVRIRPWPLRWVLGQGSLHPLSQGEAFTLASISYLAILVK